MMAVSARTCSTASGMVAFSSVALCACLLHNRSDATASVGVAAVAVLVSWLRVCLRSANPPGWYVL